MGQIVSSATKPKRCNLNKLSQLGTPAAGEHILVSSDNSMNAAGQGNFDCYIVGNGTDAATALPLIKTYANDVDDEPTAGSDKLVKSGGVFNQICLLNAKTSNIDYILGTEARTIYSGNLIDGKVVFEVEKGEVVYVRYSGATVGRPLAIALGSSSVTIQHLLPGDGYALYKDYENYVIAEQSTGYLRMYSNGYNTSVKVTVVALSQSSVINNLLSKTDAFQQLIAHNTTDGKAINQDGTLSDMSSAWGISEIEVKSGDKLKVFAQQYPDSPYVGVQVLNQSRQVVQNYILGTNLTNNEEISINIRNDGYIRIGVRISEGYENYIKREFPFRESANSFETQKKINRNVNFVGMSIWWYDGRELAHGHGGGVIAKGYQTLLKKQFVFLSDTGNSYCYSGNSLGATSVDDSSCIMNHSSAWLPSDNAIWTLDTITNDFKRNIPIGSYADYSNKTGILTYYGALREFKDKIVELSGTDAIIICSNALRRNNAGYTSTSQNTNGDTLTDFEHALMDVASRENWNFIDQFRLCGITDDSIDLTTLDGLHLNNFGYKLAVKPWIEQFKIIHMELL